MASGGKRNNGYLRDSEEEGVTPRSIRNPLHIAANGVLATAAAAVMDSDDERKKASRRLGHVNKVEPTSPMPPPDRQRNKVTVFIHVVICKLGEIDTVKECFTADVYIEAKWREPRLDNVADNIMKPNDLGWNDYWMPKLYIDNTVSEMKDNIWHLIVRNDNNEAFVSERRRLKAVFLENMELNEFPFDTQDITVTIISERTTCKLEFEEDYEELSVVNKDSFVDEQEWKLYKNIETHKKTVDKVMEGSKAAHPSISFRCHASRRFGFYIWNIFFVMFFICSMTFATFSVSYTLAQNRLQLTFILLLTTVTFKFTVNNSLPRISYLTYLDYYILSSMVILCMICVWHAIVFALITGPDVFYIDKYFLIAMAILYGLGHIGFFIFIYAGILKRRRQLQNQENTLDNELRGVDEQRGFRRSRRRSTETDSTPALQSIQMTSSK